MKHTAHTISLLRFLDFRPICCPVGGGGWIGNPNLNLDLPRLHPGRGTTQSIANLPFSGQSRGFFHDLHSQRGFSSKKTCRHPWLKSQSHRKNRRWLFFSHFFWEYMNPEMHHLRWFNPIMIYCYYCFCWRCACWLLSKTSLGGRFALLLILDAHDFPSLTCQIRSKVAFSCLKRSRLKTVVFPQYFPYQVTNDADKSSYHFLTTWKMWCFFFKLPDSSWFKYEKYLGKL